MVSPIARRCRGRIAARVVAAPCLRWFRPAFASSIWASAFEQKSNEAFIASTSLSLESVSFASSSLGAGKSAALAAQQVIRFDHVCDEVAERHLVGGRFVTEFVGGHCLDGRNSVFLAAGQ